MSYVIACWRWGTPHAITANQETNKFELIPLDSDVALNKIFSHPYRAGAQQILTWINDNDEAGQKAAKDAAGVLPPGKVFIGFLDDYKDASEALQAGDSEAIRAVCNYEHVQYKPDGIVDAKSLLDVITTPSPPSDHDYPFQGLQSKLHGIRYGELVTILQGS